MKSAVVILALVYAAAATPLLGSEKCTWGPSYWCSELAAAKECGAVDHCINTVWATKDKAVDGESKDSLCDFCHNIVSDARKMMESNETKAEIEQYLEKACALIPDQQLADMCKSAVDQYAPDIISMIANKLDPDTICAAIGLCSSSSKTVVKGTNLVRKSPPKAKAGPTLCDECKTYVQQAKDLLTDNTTEAEVEQFLDTELCDHLGEVKDLCKQVVKMYAPMIFKMLVNDMDPDAVCKAIGFCKNAMKMSLPTVVKASKLRLAIKPLGGSEECEMCKLVITEAKTKTGQKEVEDFIENNLCTRMGKLEALCKEVVEAYGPEIFSMITKDLDPESVCRAIGFCKSATLARAHAKQTPVAPPKKVKAGPQCVLCEFVMKEVDGMLAKNATEEEIVKALDTVCSILPSTIKAECTQFVDQYGPAIITLLVNELDPKVICGLLGLCSGFDSGSGKVAVGDGICDVCEYAVNFLDSLLEKNKTEQAIEDALEKVCNFMPDSIKTECDNIVEQYGPAIIQLLAQELDPKAVCEFLSMCTSGQKQQHMLGEKECTFGPTYWCASMDNAQKCGMVQHCQDHVWSL